MQVTKYTSQEAALAIKAAQGYKSWGRWMARRFAEKRGVNPSLVRLARQLQAVA